MLGAAGREESGRVWFVDLGSLACSSSPAASAGWSRMHHPTWRRCVACAAVLQFKTLGGFLQPIAHQLGGQQKLDEPGKVRGSLMLLITMTRVS